jgi:hypothetical protein
MTETTRQLLEDLDALNAEIERLRREARMWRAFGWVLVALVWFQTGVIAWLVTRTG